MEKLNLRLFDAAAGDGGASGAAAPAAGEQTGEERVVYGKQAAAAAAPDAGEQAAAETQIKVTSNTAEQRKAAFEQLINGEYKDLFGERVSQIVKSRLKDTKALEESRKQTQPLMEMLGAKYGVDSADPGALMKAIEQDEGFWEEAAEKEGLTVKAYREMMQLRRENEALTREQAEQERQRQAQEQYGQWMQQAEALKAQYPSFDFRSELQNPSFQRMLQAGVPVGEAYKVLHMDELMQGAMQVTANAVSAQVADNVRARAQRPGEAGLGGQGAVVIKSDVSKLTAKDRREIVRRAARGEHIEF